MIDAKRIKDQVKIKELLLRLGAKETNHTNLDCPFHASKTHSSLSFDDSKGIFRCASSNCKASEGGDIFNAVALAENLDVKAEFPEVLRRVCEIMNLDPPYSDIKEKENYEIRKRRINTIKECHEYFFSVCRSNWDSKEGKEILNYIIERRGLSENYIKDKLGYFSTETVKETISEIFKKSNGLKEGDKYFANTFHAFKGRIIHPHFFRGDILHFTGEATKYSQEDQE